MKTLGLVSSVAFAEAEHSCEDIRLRSFIALLKES